VSGETIPVLLTVEEAGELLRIGRTKAYAMAREWRETDGRSGLPVIDLGHVLRVPRPALEELIGADLSTITGIDRMRRTAAEAPSDPPEPRADPSPDAERARSSTTIRPPRRRQNRIADQLDLFKSDPTSG